MNDARVSTRCTALLGGFLAAACAEPAPSPAAAGATDDAGAPVFLAVDSGFIEVALKQRDVGSVVACSDGSYDIDLDPGDVIRNSADRTASSVNREGIYNISPERGWTLVMETDSLSSMACDGRRSVVADLSAYEGELESPTSPRYIVSATDRGASSRPTLTRLPETSDLIVLGGGGEILRLERGGDACGTLSARQPQFSAGAVRLASPFIYLGTAGETHVIVYPCQSDLEVWLIGPGERAAAFPASGPVRVAGRSEGSLYLHSQASGASSLLRTDARGVRPVRGAAIGPNDSFDGRNAIVHAANETRLVNSEGRIVDRIPSPTYCTERLCWGTADQEGG